MSLTDVVHARLRGHEVVAVRASAVPTLPWTAIDLVKGWTSACTTEELEDKVDLRPDAWKVVTGGKAPEGQLQALADIMGIPDLSRIVAEGLARVERGITAAFTEDQWRVTSCDDDPYEGEAPEAWAYLADTLDRYGFVDRIEQQVDGTWRVRSVRDLLTAAGGDPL